jgi:outer membrane immunogenic protein
MGIKVDHFYNSTAKASRSLLVVGACVLSSVNAFAGDMGSYVSPSWEGLYAGVELGGAWGSAKWTYKNPNYYNTLGSVLLGSKFSFKENSIIGGGNVGYNVQFGSMVLGVEGSVLGANFNYQRISPFFPTDIYRTTLDLFTEAKGRIGYACDNWLTYFSGGWVGSNVSLSLNDSNENILASAKQWSNGWIVGVGFDYLFNQNVTLGAAYNFSQLSLNNKYIPCPLCGEGIGLGAPIVDGRIQTQAVTVRLNYLFNA